MALTSLIGAVFSAVLSLVIAQGSFAAATPHSEELTGLRGRLAEAATAGQAMAAYNLGLDYDLGTSGPPDAAEALRWYRRAAEAGLADAEFNVAVMLDSGRGARRDPAEAAIWYARAAAHGDGRASFNLGLLYEQGDGVPQNPYAALAWYREAEPLPAASRKFLAVKTAIASARHPASASIALAAPIPCAPANEALVPPRADGTIELVWTAPAQDLAVRFFVEMVSLDGDRPRPVLETFSDVTAVLAQLDAAETAYAWRVFTLDWVAGRYTASPWARFAVRTKVARN